MGDIVTVITKEYVEEKLANNELHILVVNFSLPNAEFGVYYNVNNKLSLLLIISLRFGLLFIMVLTASIK